MTIGSAIQETPSTVKVYDESGRVLFDRGGTLIGYTSSTVSIQKSGGQTVTVYDQTGRVIQS